MKTVGMKAKIQNFSRLICLVPCFISFYITCSLAAEEKQYSCSDSTNTFKQPFPGRDFKSEGQQLQVTAEVFSNTKSQNPRIAEL